MCASWQSVFPSCYLSYPLVLLAAVVPGRDLAVHLPPRLLAYSRLVTCLSYSSYPPSFFLLRVMIHHPLRKPWRRRGNNNRWSCRVSCDAAVNLSSAQLKLKKRKRFTTSYETYQPPVLPASSFQSFTTTYIPSATNI